MSRCTHRLRRQGRTTGLPPSRVVRPAAATVLAVLLCWSIPDVDAATAPATIRHTEGATARQVDDGLAALDRLHSYGYTINTRARADRAIRHWQHANGLTVDGIIGPETFASLGLVTRPGPVATASVPAVRATPRATLPPAPAADVETIIRQAWPDDLEDRALAIAMRESRLQSGAINRNGDATGLFQIMWSVHRRWLCPQMNVCTQSQLLDPTTNATAAFALYQLDGWQPWSL